MAHLTPSKCELLINQSDSQELIRYMYELGVASHNSATKREYLKCLSIMRRYIQDIDYRDENFRLLSFDPVKTSDRETSEQMGIAYVIGVLENSPIALSKQTFFSCLQSEIVSDFGNLENSQLEEQRYAERCWQRFTQINVAPTDDFLIY